MFESGLFNLTQQSPVPSIVFELVCNMVIMKSGIINRDMLTLILGGIYPDVVQLHHREVLFFYKFKEITY
jgi:hypothetical protein